MAVNRACYCTRRDVMSATDIDQSVDYIPHVDSALESAADDIDRLTKRRFYNVLTTGYWDWPNWQRAYPWRIWFDEREIASITDPIPTVTSGGNPVAAGDLFWAPWNYSPPYTSIEIDRSTSATYGQGNTPQRDVAITALFGYWDQRKTAGSLAADINSSVTTVTVTDSSLSGIGDVLIVDSERMLVQDSGMADTGQTQSGTGVSTESAGDVLLTVADGTKLHVGEIVQLDQEQMLIVSVTGNVATVRRSYNGTDLATHTAATVYAPRAYTVTRGGFGTTAASHTAAGATVQAQLVPPAVRELAIGETLNLIFQKTAAYARTIGENQRTIPGGSLPDLRARVLERHGRPLRSRVV